MSQYKIGDQVTVTFLSSNYPGTILEMKPNPQAPDRIIYLVKTNHGKFIPYVGVNGSEKYANINTDEQEVIKNRTQSNAKSRRKKSDTSSSEENS